jgi:tetratricopeptide (TPR) repeat protein
MPNLSKGGISGIMTKKIGRNDPCPCGSGKKYKRCCLGKYIPVGLSDGVPRENKELIELNNLLKHGYELMEKGDVKASCETWLTFWQILKTYHIPAMKSIEDAEKIYKFDQFLSNWCQDLMMALENAARDESEYYEKLITYCEEFFKLFPDTDKHIVENIKRSQAEAYFGLGKPERGEEEFKALIGEYPDSVWAYIGWGDMYYLYRLNENIPADYDKAINIYEEALKKDLDGKEEVLRRLEELRAKAEKNNS